MKHELKKHIVTKNSNGDTRSAIQMPSYHEFKKANFQHQHDVKVVMTHIAELIVDVGQDHDITKTTHGPEFYRDFCMAMVDPRLNFTQLEWHKNHIQMERHHLNANCPDDVDLIDIIEMLVDCICAGKARSSNHEVYPVKIPEEVLKKALNNTFKLIEESVLVAEKKEPGEDYIHLNDRDEFIENMLDARED